MEYLKNMTSRKAIVAVAGVVAGLLIGFFLPSGWIFVEQRGPSDHAGHMADTDAQYACPMFCVIMDQMPEDGRCPVCGMDLTVVSGKSTLNPHERRMVGLEVGTISRAPLSRTIRVVGEVDYDETRLTRITTRMAGWLQKVWADTTWMRVKKGQKLAAIYSPELYAAQQEYLIGLRASLKQGESSAGLLEAAERRLELLGIGEQEIAELRRTQTVQESLVLRSPRDGLIVERQALEGAAVKKGAVLYTVADLSHVWVQAEVFERDLVWILEGQDVRLELQNHLADIKGRVAFIDPVINRHTRTARIRIEVPNPAGADGSRLLRVGQRVDAWIDSRMSADGRPVRPGAEPEGDPLTVPRSAVLSTGRRTVVYLLFTESMGQRDYELDPEALPETVFYQMVPLRLGPLGTRAGGGMDQDLYPVLGLVLTPDEREKLQLKDITKGIAIVTKGNLLLDSQAQLSGKPSLLFPEGSRGSSADPHAGH